MKTPAHKLLVMLLSVFVLGAAAAVLNLILDRAFGVDSDFVKGGVAGFVIVLGVFLIARFLRRSS